MPELSVPATLECGETAGAGATGAAATYQQARAINVHNDIHDNNVFGGSLREFAILLRQEFVAIDVLGV